MQSPARMADTGTVGSSLPRGVNDDLWFYSPRCHGRDFLYDHPHLGAGKLAAHCPHDPTESVRLVNADEVTANCSTLAEGFVAGFLAARLPFPPDDAAGHDAWLARVDVFKASGVWPQD